MTKNKNNIGFLIFKYGIYTILIGMIWMKLSGYTIPQMIYDYKQKRAVSKVKKYINLRNKKVNETYDLTTKEAKRLNRILYYTNDTIAINSALIQPNRNYVIPYKDPYQIGHDYIGESKRTIKNIDDFKRKKDSLGYNIFLNRGVENGFINFFSKEKKATYI